MKKRWRSKVAHWLLLIFILSSMEPVKVEAADKVAENVNLIENSGFEEGFGNYGWEPDGAYIVDEMKFEGEYSARLGTGESGCYYAISGDFTDAETVTLSAYGAVSMAGETGILNIEMRGDGNVLLRRCGIEFQNTGEMSYREATFDLEEGTTRVMVCLYKVENVRGYAYFDNVSLIVDRVTDTITGNNPGNTPSSPMPTSVSENVNLIANPGFEEGMSSWEQDGARLESEFVKSGTNSAVIGTGEGGGYYQIEGDFSEAGEITVSGWGSVSAPGEKALFGVDMFNSDSQRIGKYQIEFTAVSEYEHKSLTFPVSDATTRITIFIYKESGQGGYAYFDDLSVVVDPVQEENSVREKVIINSPPENVEYEISDIPDEYVTTIDGKDYFYRTYLCHTNSRADAGTPPNRNAELVETLTSVGNHIIWYTWEYKELTRAMWVWEYDVITDEQKRNELFAFSAEKGVNTLYMNTGDLDNGHSAVAELCEQYKAFNRKAHEMGIRVEALDGASAWVRHENHQIPLNQIRRIIVFNNEAAKEEKFDGIHHDNEPYTLPEWTENAAQLGIDYLELAEKSVELTSQNGLTYAVDIPFWYDEATETNHIVYRGKAKSLNKHIIDIVDYVGVMAYRDTALGTDSITYHTDDEVQYAAFAGKDVVVGVETYDVPDYEANPPKVTFYQEGEGYMNQEIAKVIRYFCNGQKQLDYRPAPGFKGMAVHYYTTYKDLPYEPR